MQQDLQGPVFVIFPRLEGQLVICRCMELEAAATEEEWQLEDLLPALQTEDLGHVLCQLHLSALNQSPQHTGQEAGMAAVLQALRAAAWCSGWHAANCSRGFGNNARCDEVLLATASEDVEVLGRQYGLSARTIDSLLEAIHSSAWHCANSKFGNRFDAEEDFQTAQKHWITVKRGAELDGPVIASLQNLIWNACWCTVNWRSGSDLAKHNLRHEQRQAQVLGLCKKAAWAPHTMHWKCNREMAWKQAVATNFLFSNSLVAIAERGGFKHKKVKLQQKVKKCISVLKRHRS